jgi:hypothetical protein
MENTKLVEVGEKPIDILDKVICSDYDEDCKDVKNKTMCWFYMPACGTCPYLTKEQDE